MQACEAAKRCARQRRWYPKNVLVAVVLFVAFGLALDSSVDFKRGAAVGVPALAA